MICPLCSSKKNNKIFIASNVHGRIKYGHEKVTILKCVDCQCIFPDVGVNSKYYKKFYPKHYQQASSFLEKFWISLNHRRKLKYLPQKGDLLDIGCGNGEFINQLPKSLKSIGIDLNPIEVSQKNILQKDFLKYKFTQKFDVITFWHSLEHFSHPHKTINKALSLLKTKGKLVISIPNTNSLSFKIGQKYWYHLDAPRHIFLPNESNIKKLFGKNHIVTIEYTPFEFPLDLFWSLKKKPVYRLFYPILKIFDRETMVISVVKP